MRERPLNDVPKPVWLLLAAGLALQAAIHFGMPPPAPAARQLASPPSAAALRLFAAGDAMAAARLASFYLQGFDNQPGLHLPFRKFDYARVSAWLDTAADLDPHSSYPMFLAVNVYGAYTDPVRKRIMLDYAYRRFMDDPNRHWAQLARAALIAKHELKDLPLARRYAQAVRLHATAPEVPPWARELEIYVLEDMNEIDGAKSLLAGLLYSGQIKDQHELEFLRARLEELERRAAASASASASAPAK